MNIQMCRTCKTDYPATPEYFHKASYKKSGMNSQCKSCACEKRKRERGKYADKIRQYNREYLDKNPDKGQKWNTQNRTAHLPTHMVNAARRRARVRGVPFSITPADVVIPKCCPVLGMILKIGQKHARPDSPSLDVIMPEKGYVPGNVAVISYLANSIKQNVTHDQIRKVADWLERAVSQVPPPPS